jgi:signal peptidase I
MKNWIRGNRRFLLFVVLYGLFRTACADWNSIPSGSMRPSLLEGDVVLVNRLAYAVKVPLTDVVVARTGEPRRGDIVTFSSPLDGTRLIKRVIALPGDTVSMRDKRLTINGETVHYSGRTIRLEPLGDGRMTIAEEQEEMLAGRSHEVQWLPERSVTPDLGPVIVPPDQYLMLGDNRDNSADSRYFGFVPRERLIGRAEGILVSAAILDNWLPRFSRFGKRLD